MQKVVMTAFADRTVVTIAVSDMHGVGWGGVGAGVGSLILL